MKKQSAKKKNYPHWIIVFNLLYSTQAITINGIENLQNKKLTTIFYYFYILELPKDEQFKELIPPEYRQSASDPSSKFVLRIARPLYGMVD